MGRILLALIVGVLLFDASGLDALVLPERCASVADTTPDNNCPSTCIRCACGQPMMTVAVATVSMPAPATQPADEPSTADLPQLSRDIFHVPKLASLTF